MEVFVYDKSFEGLLCCVFEAYSLRCYPEVLLAVGEPAPLFGGVPVQVRTNAHKASRVWTGMQKKVSGDALTALSAAWLSEAEGVDMLLFRYIRKAIDAPRSIEVNFGDADVLEVARLGKKVMQEKHRVIQFARFQKTADGIFFAAMEPLYDVIPLAIAHFKDRFADQRWVLYDIKRQYGFYYDLHTVEEVVFAEQGKHLLTGLLDAEQMSGTESLFQELWKGYFASMAIKERINPKLHRQNLPRRFWKYLTEKQ